jgi:uncharacterized membrane protein YgcG
MAPDRLRNSGLMQSLTDLLADLSDLVQKEIRLAKAEVTEKITAQVQASIWMVAAAFLGLVAALLVVEAAVFALASFGLALYWSCLPQVGPPHFITGVRLRSRGFSQREPPNRSQKTSRQPRSS